MSSEPGQISRSLMDRVGTEIPLSAYRGAPREDWQMSSLATIHDAMGRVRCMAKDSCKISHVVAWSDPCPTRQTRCVSVLSPVATIAEGIKKSVPCLAI